MTDEKETHVSMPRRSSATRSATTRRSALVVLVMVVLASLLGTPTAAAERPVTSVPGPAQRPPAVVFDSDMDFDDASTLALLCNLDLQGRLDLRAVTITGNGMGLPGRAEVHAATILRRCGLPTVPIGTANPAPSPGGNTVSPDSRVRFERVLTDALGDAAATSGPLPAADQLVRQVVAESRGRVTILATGPLTTPARLLTDPRIRARIDRVVAMGGAFDVPVNIFGPRAAGFDKSQEVNIWLDPRAAATVNAAARPGQLTFIPLDATDSVPVSSDLIERLPRTPAGNIVRDIMQHPSMPAMIATGALYWWDPLAALSLVQPELVRTTAGAVHVTVAGPAAGRTSWAAKGPRRSVASGADRAAFEQAFLAALA
ncbi:nucleoside hydrolase [Nakamurella aerolata]|uniref:Nucleoside hydrolase n=1 Tax=Nakamurella aerolata TaxID=1656892 RepID=A0A849A3Y3_9ACTN|nr:nucleoside hydrolase [Nakamurella aerolata]